MKSEDKNRVQIKNLLEVYSLEQISELFSKIDNKILSLHKSSSEDFLNLNRDFKSFYLIANKISYNASNLFEFLAGQDNQFTPSQLEKFYYQLKSHNDLLEYQLFNVEDIVNSLLSKVRQTFFPVKNFKQNLTSLRFLETNLELDYESDYEIEPNIIGELSVKAKDQLVLIEKSFQKLKKLVKNRLFEGQKVYSEELNIKDILNDLQKELKVYTEHYEKATKQIPEIKKRTDNTKQSISKIITNLQYHDIIKQKMEHIQQTHKDLVDELDKIHKQHDVDDLNEKAKYFIRIRDIAGLQAAQLMQTNKEYQTAIQRISDKFLEIGEDMSYVAKKCTEYTSFDGQDQKVFFDSLKINLNKTKSKISQFCHFKEEFNNSIKEVTKIINQVVTLNENIDLLIKEIKKYLDLKNENSRGGSDKKGLYSQVNQLYNDLLSNKNNLDYILSEIKALKGNLDKNILDRLSTKEDTEEAEVLPEKVDKYINGLSEIEAKILEKLSDNNQLSESILSDIQKSVGKISYYDYFEDIIEDIINELNTINYQLRFDEDKVKNKEDNLKKLKEYYTMNSEFVIHEHVTNGNEEDIEVSEDGGDLELF